MELKRIKQYKAKLPAETITQIRDILFSKLGIILKEEQYQDKDSKFFSSRISLCNNLERYNIGTNGKGMTFEYSLASAYGEFMERLQNNFLFVHHAFARRRILDTIKGKFPDYYENVYNLGLDLEFTFCPDEIYINSKIEINNVIDKYIKIDNIEFLKQNINNDKGLVLLPYCNIFKKEIENLPIELIFHNGTSNGMCAGNTSKEAIIQGVSEIFERYVIRLLYQKNITPPTIPLEFFKGNKIYQNILELENEYDLLIEVKDCSCNIGIPAIGVLITDKQRTKYQFHIGVDPSPITALERSLTEVFQGRSNIYFHDINFPYQYELLTNIELKEREMWQTLVNSLGRYPISILETTESYEFCGFNENLGISDEYDLKFLLLLIKKLGYEIYIRDVSFLGFPAFHIFIPGMSEIKNIFSNNHFKNSYSKSITSFLVAHNIQNASTTEIQALLDYLYHNENNYVTKFLNYKDAFIYSDKSLIKCILYYKIGQNKEAIDLINKCIETTSNEESKILYKCIRDIIFIYYKDSNSDLSLLQYIYPGGMVETVNDFLKTNSFFEYFNFSSCFDCEKCKIKSSCSFIDLIKLSKKIENVYIQNIPVQKDMIELMNEIKFDKI